MPESITFFYDVVCPYAFMGSRVIDQVGADLGREVEWVPMLLGGVFRHHGSPQVPASQMAPARARLNLLDIHRSAEQFGLPNLRMPLEHPRRTVSAMRLCVAAPAESRREVSKALFEAYWLEGRDVADREVLDSIAREHGIDPALLDDPSIKQRLFETTERAARAGVFGAPTMEVGGRIFWGADRMPLLRAFLGEPRDRAPLPPSGPHKITFFHDFSSPFSYLGATQAARVAAEAGAELEWVPILLGALFKSIGTPIIPMMAFSGPKQKYYLQDLTDWAGWWDVPFTFNAHFPVRTVAALRVAILEPDVTPHLYRAVWADSLDLGDPAVLTRVLDEAGFDGASLLARTQEPAVKQQLRDNTDRAIAAGVCGVPTFQVDDGPLFWGQDRLDHVEAALRGWVPALG